MAEEVRQLGIAGGGREQFAAPIKPPNDWRSLDLAIRRLFKRSESPRGGNVPTPSSGQRVTPRWRLPPEPPRRGNPLDCLARKAARPGSGPE